jgi:hypothetical protein
MAEKDAITPLVASYTVNPAAVGTALVSAPGTITAFSLAQPAAGADMQTPIVVVDATAASYDASLSRAVFAANLGSIPPLNGYKPGIAPTPGSTAPTWPMTFGTQAIAFSKGLYVKSCPAGAVLTITA